MALNFPNNPADGDIYQALGRGWKYNGTAGIWEALIRVNTAFDSDDITEGSTNLYQNPENIQDEVNNLLVAGTNITLTYDDVANTLTIDAAGGGGGGSSAFTGLTDTPANFTGAAGQYVRVNATETALEYDTLTTADVSEGANLYYTDARVDTHLNQTGPTAGYVLSWNGSDYAWVDNAGYTDSDVDTHLNQSTAANGEFLKWNGSDYEWDTVPAGYTDSDVNTFLAGGTAGNIVTTGYLAGPATFTIDPAAVGDNTGTVVIAGNLQVDGTTTTINSTTLDVDDLNITVASGAANAAAATGAGLTVDGAGATFTYTDTDDRWNLNKDLNVSTVYGNVTGQVSDISNHSINGLSDVDIVTAAPTNGQALVWDNANSKFIPGDSFSQSDFDTAFAAKSTNELSEGSDNSIGESSPGAGDGTNNLYYTDARADARVNLQTGANLDLSSKSTTDLPEGTNLYYTDQRADIRATLRVTAADIGNLNNVDETGVADGKILKYNSTTSNWEVADDETAVATLGSIGNVNTTGVANNDILYYNNSANEWQVDSINDIGISNAFFDIFTATGSSNQFNLSQDPGSSAAVQVFLDGVPQLTNNYTVVGTTLTLGGMPTNGQIVEVKGYGLALDIGTVADASITGAKLQDGTFSLSKLEPVVYQKQTFTGDGNTTQFTLDYDPGYAHTLLVLIDNVVQEPTENYTTSGTTLTFTSAPLLSSRIYIRYLGLPAGSSSVPPDGTITNAKLSLTYTSDQFTGDGSTVDYTVPTGHNVNSVLVVLDGLILPPSDYSITTGTLTFGSAPLLDQSIDIRYMPI